jgi:opacity protein-like surface antigen
MGRSFMKIKVLALALAGLTLGGVASAQTREAGWDVGMDLIYQDSKTIHFDGGSTIALDDDWGVSFNFGYRFNPHLELHFAFDYSEVDYSGNLVLGNGGGSGVRGDMEAFTPRVDLHYNLLTGPVTPYVMAGIGYSFIDTNIPNGRPSTGCWWDPWYGYICTSVQPTKGVDEWTYQTGLGVRWDFARTTSLRLSAEKHWIDLPNAGSPGVMQFKLGFVWRGY